MILADLSRILVKIFGSRNQRLVKSYSYVAQEAGRYEDTLKALSDDQLKAKTAEFKASIAAGISIDDILPEAFAAVREAAQRNVQMRHFDVQLIGGNVLYEGKIAEMATGEGKTLVATLAVYMMHLAASRVHVVTVNDYLAKRDAEWMGPIYRALGLTVGAIQADMDTIGDERKAQYACDVTYGTNNEFGFDYLRDNMKISLEQMAQGPLDYAIVDEVDSILIDEARTPLIISGPAQDDVSRYKKADLVARHLMSLQAPYDHAKKQLDAAQRTIANAEGELAEAKREKNAGRVEKAQQVIEKTQRDLESFEAKLPTLTQYYEVEYDKKSLHLTHEGVGAAQESAGVGSFYTGSNMDWPHLIEQSLRAHVVFEREKDYVVMEGKVIIVDEFTGRLMHGRQWSDGLHQAVEAKEAVQVKEETQTLATITLQNFFKLYKKIAGMTGTAATEASEFVSIYKLEVVTIPTNKPCVRDDRNDLIYKSLKEKFNAIVEEIHEVSGRGRPVLVGTVSIEKSEALSEALTKKYGIEHEVLNAKQHAREAAIVAKAGQQHQTRDGSMRGNVTIATNMAGRGTDIKLAPEVLWDVQCRLNPAKKNVYTYTLTQRITGRTIEIDSDDRQANIWELTPDTEVTGGLHILGTERHEARRIDNQLRGRAGRQGDAGSSQFFLSFEDELMSVFAPEWTVKALSWIGWEEGEPIYHSKISKGIEKAQKKVEERNFEARKSLLDYDEVMDYQRKIFYGRRREILSGRGLRELIEAMIDATIEKNSQTRLDQDYPFTCIIEWAKTQFGVELRISDLRDATVEEIEKEIKKQAREAAANNISLSIGEFLEDYEDQSTWDVQGLSKWAMSSFSVSLTPSKIKSLKPEDIEAQLTQAASEQVDKKDCSVLADFLKDGFALRTYAEWARAKFDVRLDANELKELSNKEIEQLLRNRIDEKYTQREIEYPVEFAMNMVYGPQGPNIYGFETLAAWANKKYNAGMTAQGIQESSPRAVLNQLMDLSRAYNNGKLVEEIDSKLNLLDRPALAEWAKTRFETPVGPDVLGDGKEAKQRLVEIGREFMRRELSDLEKYVLLQIYDGEWKDHLYAMDRMRDSIFLRALAERDPKIEYKHEGYRMFTEMLEAIEERVTDIIFKVHLEAGARARSVWNVSSTSHQEVGQFEMAERQRAAAQSPQGQEAKVKQIKLETPKVGRNDPCPCGSGKKYKKCHGANA
jgi:preprotein translocase subunit SecA